MPVHQHVLLHLSFRRYPQFAHDETGEIMEVIRGKQTFQVDALALARRLIGYHQILIDLGTGDGHLCSI